MSVGLLALLDDIAALVKAGAANFDGISVQVVKTGSKVSGVVIDDAAVTPKYVVGLDPKRELAIIFRIAKSSLINKLLFLAPAIFILGLLAPFAIQPILMLGGAYLCFEGYEKIHSIFSHSGNQHPEKAIEAVTPTQLENARVKSAVRTDLILSAEIIAITYGSIVNEDIVMQIIVMICVAVGITAAVYGFVGLIVKADDIGIHIAKRSKLAILKNFGLGIVHFMPHFLVTLGYTGTAAMLWVGADIILHGFPFIHYKIDKLIENLPTALIWLTRTLISIFAGLVLGFFVEKIIVIIKRFTQSLFIRNSISINF